MTARHRTRPRVTARRLAPLALLPFVLLSALPGCDEGEAADPDAGPSGTSSTSSTSPDAIVDPDEVARAIRDLVTAVTPLPPEAPVGVQSDWYPNRRATLKRLRAAGPAVGAAALAEYRERTEDLDDIRAGLLDVAAHAATEDTVEILADLVTTYGPSLKLRRAATELLGDVAPARAHEVLAPILAESRRGRTYPPDDIMMASWLRAAATLEIDRVPLLAEVALDYRQSQEARHVAAEALGAVAEHEDRAAAGDALRTLLVESSGNNYLRRKAAQSLRTAVGKEELCAILEDVLSKEADSNFGLFLSDMIENHCR